MLLPYIVGREYRDKLRWRRCLFHRRSSFRFFALHQAHDAGNVEAELAGGFDGLNCGGAGGADVVDNDDACAFLAEPFNALSGAVLFFSFTYKKAVNRAARHGDGDHDWVGAHGEAADGLRVPTTGANFVEKDLASELRAARIKRGGAAIDVIVAGASGGELELAQLEGLAREQAQQFLACVGHEFPR